MNYSFSQSTVGTSDENDGPYTSWSCKPQTLRWDIFYVHSSSFKIPASAYAYNTFCLLTPVDHSDFVSKWTVQGLNSALQIDIFVQQLS